MSATTKAIAINQILNLIPDVLTVSLFYVIYYFRCLAGWICDCTALVLAVAFYCFHQHTLLLYDLSKYYTLMLEEARRAKGEMKENHKR